MCPSACKLRGGKGAEKDEKEGDLDSDAFNEQLTHNPSLSLCQDWLDTFEDPDLRAAASDPDKWKDIMRENARLMYGSADEKENDEL